MHKENYLYPNKGMPRLENETKEVSPLCVQKKYTYHYDYSLLGCDTM